MVSFSFRVPKTKADFKRAIVTDTEYAESSQWINKDLVPTPKAARTWSWISLSSYWWGVRIPFIKEMGFMLNNSRMRLIRANGQMAQV
jgi:cytosine/uracil/thiamine/allantoin permease